MRKKYMALIIVLMFSLILGLGAAWDRGNNNLSVLSVQEGENKELKDNTDPIQIQLNEMTLEEKIGQLVMVGVAGYEKDDLAIQLIKKYHVGGFILLKKNIKDNQQMLALINSLKEINAVNKIPLFLSIDEEGGRVSRMPAEFPKLPSNQKIGELNDCELSYQVGSIIGEELKAFGLNMNFGPVFDVNSNPSNPVIGDRAFGDDADIVGKLGVQTMKGLQGQNIIPVAKHFPGHGDTAIDSHIGLPIVNNDVERLNSLELLPFSAAIKNKVDVIMIAHILLPEIDPNNPATFSPTIISGILRKNMEFTGVVITDDLTMGAIVNNYDLGEAAVKSINAGSDIVLVCHGYDKEEAVIKAIQKAAVTGVIPLKRINESVYRILKLKDKYALTDSTAHSVEAENIYNKINVLYKDYPSLK